MPLRCRERLAVALYNIGRIMRRVKSRSPIKVAPQAVDTFLYPLEIIRDSLSIWKEFWILG